jgi:Nif-specific regulatory protein
VPPRGPDPRHLSDLLEISQALGGTLHLRAALLRVLAILEEKLGALSATVVLRDAGAGDLVVEAASGSGASSRATRYRLGEGIVGRVAQTGRPAVVRQVSREPLFLDRSGAFRRSGRSEMSFVCVPIRSEHRPAGALGVALPYEPDRRYEQEARLFGLVGSMIGRAVGVHHLVESERRRLVDENARLRREVSERYDTRNLVGSSRAMQAVHAQVAQVAPAGAPVLLRGEAGTGKELVAHAIHYSSPRAKKPFVKASCAALPESLVESELFGHEPGAFTDARAQKKGRFELAQGGTLFLDEIGELAPATQVKLLRVLRERELERLGGVRPVKVNVRLIAATNRDLEAAVKAGGFREDLYHRLGVHSIFLPPLRERKTDVPLLADHFVEKHAAAHGKDVRRIATSAVDMLMSYHWPGNVRELESCIERAVLVCEGGAIHAHHLPPTLQTAEVSGTLARQSLREALDAYEKDLVLDALKSARGNRARAARVLQTTERILGYAVRKHGIDVARFR